MKTPNESTMSTLSQLNNVNDSTLKVLQSIRENADGSDTLALAFIAWAGADITLRTITAIRDEVRR